MEVIIGKLSSIQEKELITLYGGTTYLYKVLINNIYYRLFKRRRIKFDRNKVYVIILSKKTSLIYDMEEIEYTSLILRRVRGTIITLILGMLLIPLLGILIVSLTHEILTLPLVFVYIFVVFAYFKRRKMVKLIEYKVKSMLN